MPPIKATPRAAGAHHPAAADLALSTTAAAFHGGGPTRAGVLAATTLSQTAMFHDRSGASQAAKQQSVRYRSRSRRLAQTVWRGRGDGAAEDGAAIVNAVSASLLDLRPIRAVICRMQKKQLEAVALHHFELLNVHFGSCRRRQTARPRPSRPRRDSDRIRVPLADRAKCADRVGVLGPASAHDGMADLAP